MRALITLAALIATLALIGGCSKKDNRSETVPPAKVTATAAYQQYFGPAPVSGKGTCFAFVIFFPSAQAPGKVTPFPFFTFDEASLKKVALERLFTGMDVGSYQGQFVGMPAGARITSIDDSAGTITIKLSKEFNTAIENKTAEGIANAMAATLRQFRGVTAVRIFVEGDDTPLKPAAAADNIVIPPGPPRLLSVTAMREKGAKHVEEVNAFFDRPVEIKALKLFSQDGQQYPGDTYHAVFDMAAVLKPKDPAIFVERLPIKVQWKVVDKLGRQAEGDNVWLLEVKEH